MEILLNSWIFYTILSTIPLIYWYLTRNHNYWNKLGVKGPKPIIGFGTVLYQFFREKSYIELDWIHKYGKIYGTFEGNEPILTVGEPELIKNILVKDFHVFNYRSTNTILESKAHPILVNNLLATNGNQWKRIRSIVSPTFSSGRMKKMFPMIKQCLNELLNTLEMYANDKKEVDMKLMYENLTMDVISTCAFATKTNSYKDPNSPFIKNAHKSLNPKSYRLVLSIMLPKFVMKFINMKHTIEETCCEFFFKLTRLIINDRKNKKDKANEVSDEFDSNESHHVNEGKEELEIQK
ncbi:unnamed protein product, partial [Oppiella nova]